MAMSIDVEELTPGLLAEIACAASSWLEVERATVELLVDQVGADTVFFADEAGPTETCVGVVASERERVRPIWPSLIRGGEALVDAARAGDGVVIDSELFGRDLERLPYYDALMRPVRGRSTLMAFLTRPRREPKKLALGRCQGSRDFDAGERALVAALVPTLTLASAAFGHADAGTPDAGACLERLTPREREVLDYLRLGYSNEQIGLALGTRPRTVRNQLSRAYEKLGVSTRAEAVGLVLGSAARNAR